MHLYVLFLAQPCDAVQECDARGDAMKNFSPAQNDIEYFMC